jgi:hypothetical protein
MYDDACDDCVEVQVPVSVADAAASDAYVVSPTRTTGCPMTVSRTTVPCAGCTACCRNEVLVLEPENGDDVDSYEHDPVAHPITGRACVIHIFN